MPDISSSFSNFSNSENDLFSSPLITFRGKILNGPERHREPPHETFMVRSSPRRLNGRFSSPRKTTPNSPKIISRLPIRSSQNSISRFSIKDLHLPSDDLIVHNPKNDINNEKTKVTPEKLMQELRLEVKKKQRKLREIDEEISLSIPFTDGNAESFELSRRAKDNGLSKPRMSLRNRCPVIVDSPDLFYEDPLEVARETLQNTRLNSGYKQIKLIYTTERRGSSRSRSPDPAFSKKKGIKRHLLNLFDGDDSEDSSKLKFDRVLKLFEAEDDVGSGEEFFFNVNLDAKPKKSCLKPVKASSVNDKSYNASKAETVQIRKIYYDGEEEEGILNKFADRPGSPSKKRRLSSGNGQAKRLKITED